MEHEKTIQTDRLRLEAATAESVAAELQSHNALSERLGARVPPEWPPPLMADVVPLFLHSLRNDPSQAGWLSWYWVLRAEADGGDILVGAGGFTGRPASDGSVEIGYSVLSDYHGRGFATEALAGLLAWAFRGPELSVVYAQTFPDLPGSVRVLEKNRFQFVGPGSEEGALKYELTRQQFFSERT